MDTARLLQEVEAEISRLQQVAELLRDGTSTSPKQRKQRKQRAPMSKEAREKIAAAQRKRWAKQKKSE
jgi:hypothetical protein